MRLFFIFFIFFNIIYSQDYSPKKYYNPENKIETKTRDVSKLKDLFNSVLLKEVKKRIVIAQMINQNQMEVLISLI